MKPENLALLIPIIALCVPMIIAPAAILTRYYHRKREWQHREQMKALEMGVSLDPAHGWPAALVASAIGAGVPIGVFFIAWMVALTTDSHHDKLFEGAIAVGLAGVYAGYKLGSRMQGLAKGSMADAQAQASRNAAKPYADDPDAYDVAGRRG